MRKNEKSEMGYFLRISEEIPFIQSLRKQFGIQNILENLTFSSSEVESEGSEGNLREASLLIASFERIYYDKKGNKALIWISPRPGVTTGVLSDTFIDLMCLVGSPGAIIHHILKKKKSKYYLIEGWKPQSQGSFCEPVHIPVHEENSDFQLKSSPILEKIALIQPRIYYRNEKREFNSEPLKYFLPVNLLTHHIGDSHKPLDGGRRIQKSILVDWGYLTENNGLYTISTDVPVLLEQFQNLILLEWWRAVFTYKLSASDIQNYEDIFNFSPKQIILRAFFDSLIYNRKMSIQCDLITMSKILQIEQEEIRLMSKNWMLEEYYVYECIQDGKFVYPPSSINRFWADWKIIQNRYHNALVFFGRTVELKHIYEELQFQDRLFVLKGQPGIGKTRLILEFAKENEQNWEVLWLLQNQEISWQAIKNHHPSKKLLLVIDNIAQFEDWEMILDHFLQIEMETPRIKLLIVANSEEMIQYFISKHSNYRTQTKIEIFNLKPIDFSQTLIKNEIIRILLKKEVKFEMIPKLLDFSEGFPEVIEEEIPHLIQKNDLNDNSEFISIFEQRMIHNWENMLNKDEKTFLTKLCLFGHIGLNIEPLIPLEKNEYSKMIEGLIQKQWVQLIHFEIVFTRYAFRNWIMRKQWIKQKSDLSELISFIVSLLNDEKIHLFLNSIEFLRQYLNFVEFKEIIEKIETWGDFSSFRSLNNKMLVLNRLMPYIAKNFMENLNLSQIEPSSIKEANDESLSSDIPSSIKIIIVKIANKWFELISSVSNIELIVSHQNLHVLLMTIQKFDLCMKICQAMRNKIHNTKNSKKYEFYSSALILIELSIQKAMNTKRNDEFYNRYLNEKGLKEFEKGLILEIWVEESWKRKDFDFNQTYSLTIQASDYFAATDHKFEFIHLWANFLPSLTARYYLRSNFLQKYEERYLENIQQKINLAGKWAKELSLTKEYISFNYNWMIFDNSTNSRENIKSLNEMIKIALKSKQYYLVGNIYHQLGLECSKLQENWNAVDSFKKSIEFTEKSLVFSQIDHTYYELGKAYWHINQMEKARASFRKSFKLYIKQGKRSDALSALNSIYDIYFAEQNYNEAIKMAEEIQFYASQVKDSVYYKYSILRSIETKYLQKDWKGINKLFEKIQNEKIENFDEQQTQYLLLKNIVLLKSKNVLSTQAFEEYARGLEKFDLQENSFHFYWILRFARLLFNRNLTQLDFLLKIISQNKSLCSNQMSIYEILLQSIHKILDKRDTKDDLWPEWGKYIINKFERPKLFQDPISGIIANQIGPEFHQDNLVLKTIITNLDEISETKNDTAYFREVFPKLLQIFPQLLMSDLTDSALIERIWQVLEKTYLRIKNNPARYLKNQKDSLRIFDEFFLNLLNQSLEKDFLALTQKMGQFYNNNIFSEVPEDIQIKYLENQYLTFERMGEKEEALKKCLELQKYYKKNPQSIESRINTYNILILELHQGVTPDLETIIINFYNDSITRSDTSSFLGQCLKVYLFIKKHQIHNANQLALSLSYKKIDNNSILYFISEFIDRIFIQEDLYDAEINQKIVEKYLFLLETDEELQNMKLIAAYGRSLIAIFNNSVRRVSEKGHLDTYLNRCFRVIKILKLHNWEDLEPIIENLSVLMYKFTREMVERNELELLPQFYEKMYNFAEENAIFELQIYSIVLMLLHLSQSRQNEDYFLWFVYLFETSFLKLEDVPPESKIMEGLRIIAGKFCRDFGNYEILNNEETLEFLIVFFLEISIQRLYEVQNIIEPQKMQKLCDNIWLAGIKSLNFKIRQKLGQKFLICIWSFLLHDFSRFIVILFEQADKNNKYLIFNELIASLNKFKGWEKDIGTIWMISTNFIQLKLGDKQKQINSLCNKIENEIPNELSDEFKQHGNLIKNSLSDRDSPVDISKYFVIAYMKGRYSEYIIDDNISKATEIILAIIQIYFKLRDYISCKVYIEEAEKLFKENGRNRDLMVLEMYQGMISYESGNWKKADEKFIGVVKNLRLIETWNQLLSYVYLFAIRIEQGNDKNQIAREFFENIKEIWLEEQGEDFNTFPDRLMSNLFSINKPQLISIFSDYFSTNSDEVLKGLGLLSTDYDKIQFNFIILSQILLGKNDKAFQLILKRFNSNQKDVIRYIFNPRFFYWLPLFTMEVRINYNSYMGKNIRKLLGSNRENALKKPLMREDVPIEDKLEDYLTKDPQYLRILMKNEFPEYGETILFEIME